MKSVEALTACVVDHGLFLPVARRLAKEYAKVFYYSPWDTDFPSIKERCIGDGFDEVERVENIWDVKSKCDLFVFPDIGFGGEQRELIAQGYPVWGHHGADGLETHKGKFFRALKECGLEVPKHVVCRGMENLRAFLRTRRDQYVKVDMLRKDWETFHWVDEESSGEELNHRAMRLGPLREAIAFYVLEPIDTEIEDGCDTWCIDGRWPETVVHGMEAKDKAYLGTFQKLADLPEEVKVVNERFGPVLEKFGIRGSFSTEVRITDDKKSFFIDPTVRFGSPPSQTMCRMIANLGEIVWAGANGEVVEPVPVAKFGVQAILSMKNPLVHWEGARFDEGVDEWVSCGWCCRYGGVTLFAPNVEKPDNDIGWLTAVGDSIEEAVENLKDNASQLPDGVSCATDALKDLIEEIQTAEKAGMEFTDEKIPDPSIALD